MTSMLSTFTTHLPTHRRDSVRPMGMFGRKTKHSWVAVAWSTLRLAYHAAQAAQMRRIEMQLALHGVRDRADAPEGHVTRK